MRLKWTLILSGLILLLAACAGPAAEVQPTAAPEPTTIVAEPTAAPDPTITPAATAIADEPTAVAADPTTIAVEPTTVARLTATAEASAPPDPGFGRTEEGYYTRGQADAPVVINDYSDFL